MWGSDVTSSSVREQVIERDGLCFLCYRAGSQIHHVVPRSLIFGPLRDDIRNQIVLCQACHTDAREAHDEIVRILGMLHDRYGYEYPEPQFRQWAAEMYEERQ